ncbi:myosin-binding protein 3-like [Impatiens glandulifera]|uniref:myosin-binding protein 3-like n=1 Tax=Impatiens glandulifera TaxID=253017 RepID=UPI001FB0E616|nr:myosin-binding protein 3-like [Impatiens glandulifera]
MACQTVNSWTFSDIVGAFVELAIAYFLLCASSVVFIASKFLGVFGLSLPCTCTGILGNSCLHRLLLVHCLNEDVSSIQLSLKNNHPFESILEKNQDCQLNLRLVSDSKKKEKHRGIENAASCSSVSSARDFGKNSFHMKKIEDGVGSTHKQERVTNERARRGFRRRKKVLSDYGKENDSSVSPYHSSISQVGDVCHSMSSIHYKMGRENAPLPADYGSNTIGFGDLGETAPQDFERENKLIERSSSSSEENMRTAVSKEEKNDTIGILEQALEQERAAKAALYLDLEEERNAAASAADEAMAMILRLQEQKGSVEMESRQYHRMIEEKSAYDEEEMDILKEILTRRENEKHFLENEIEAYREMHYLENKPLQDEIQLLPSSFNLSEDPVSNDETLLGLDTEEDSQEKKSGWSSATESSDAYNYFTTSRSSRRVGRKNLDKGLPPLGNSKEKAATKMKRNSLSAVDTERLKIENEVGLLRERLRNIQAGREKIKLPVDYPERDKNQLQLLEDIARQLREIQVLTEPGKVPRQASLPTTPPKVQSKKSCVRSASMGILNNP